MFERKTETVGVFTKGMKDCGALTNTGFATNTQ